MGQIGCSFGENESQENEVDSKKQKKCKTIKKGKKKVTIRGLKVGKTSVTAKIYGKKGKIKRVTIVVKVLQKERK